MAERDAPPYLGHHQELINNKRSGGRMKDIQDALARVGKHLAEIGQAVVNAIDNLTPEQRLVIEFLADNPEVAEAFQELNQKLARQRAIGGVTKETAQPKEPLIKDEKVRKAVRAWAEATCVSEILVAHPSSSTTTLADISNPYNQISFSNERAFLPMGKEYTIAELCGEEEE